MFSLDSLPADLRPTEACTNRFDRDLDDQCSERLSFFRTIAPKVDDQQFHRRHAKALMSLVPFLATAADLSSLRVLEVGSGHAAKAFALAPFVDEYIGLEIQPNLVEFAEETNRQFNLENLHFVVDQAANINAFLDAQDRPFDLILLYAVLEHLTMEEKLELLEACWGHLTAGGLLFIGETPNRMIPIDLHSSHLLYHQQAPKEIWTRTFMDAGNKRWADALSRAIKQDKFDLTTWRRGRHLGHQEFDLSMMPVEQLRRHTVADCYSPYIMNLYRYLSIEYLKLVEFGFLSEYEDSAVVVDRNFPSFFSRYFLEALLVKEPLDASMPDIEMHARVGDGGGRVVTGAMMTPETLGPDGLRYELARSTPISEILIGFEQPMRSTGTVEVRVNGAAVHALDVAQSARKLRTWRGELAYTVHLDTSRVVERVELVGPSSDNIKVRYVGFR